MKSFVIGIFGILFLFNMLTFMRMVKLTVGAGKSKEKEDLTNLSDADLDKMMKEYGLNSKDLGVLSGETDGKKANKQSGLSSKKNQSASKTSKDLLMDLNVDDDPLKNLLDGDKKGNNNVGASIKSLKEIYSKNKESLRRFELTQREAFNLIFAISKYSVFNKLPLAAMNIINEVEGKKSFQEILKQNTQNQTEEMDYLISNTLNSQTFIDHENRVGRKGMLTIVDKNTAEIKQVWAVLNNKVFCFYKSSNHLKILHIYRVSQMNIKNFNYSPCFFLYYEGDNSHKSDNSDTTDFTNTQLLVCALNFKEKEVWIKTLDHHKKEYSNN